MQNGLGMVGNVAMTVTVIQSFKDDMPLTSANVRLSFFDPFLVQMTCDHKMDGAVMTFANNAIGVSFADSAAAQEYIDYCAGPAKDWISPIVSQTIVPYNNSEEWIPLSLNPYFPHHEVPENYQLPPDWPL